MKFGPGSACCVRLLAAPKRFSVPRWAAALVAGWLGLVGLYEWLAATTDHRLPLCVFRGLTSLPCPTCGTTRATLAFARGDILAGVLYNPFVVTALAIGLALCAVQWGFGKRIEIAISPRSKRFGWALVAVLFLTNWAYLIARGI